MERHEHETTPISNGGIDIVEKNQMDIGVSWLNQGLAIVEKYKLKTIFKAFFIMVCIAAFIGFLKNPTWIFEKYDEWKKQ